MSDENKYYLALAASVLGGIAILYAFFSLQKGDVSAVWPLVIGFATFGIAAPATVYFKSRMQIDKRKK
ncbi:MAG TPA: hypothetical protein VFT87_01830 [Candidatus Saccharimonadales bacterium]|nr:hypothetical protein [Candidatus Saccharimonadales bacterium]